jgi:cation:H+ antiporter
MSLLVSILLLVAGFALLIKGADWLVEGASALARSVGMSDLMIGLTIVAFGTSAPELLVNVMASLQGNADIVMGDIVGSNIANTFLVLGIAAMITSLSVQTSTVWKEIPLNLLIGIILFVMMSDMLLDGSQTAVTRSEGVVLIGFFFVFLYYTFFMKRGNGEHHSKQSMPLSLALLLVIIGCILLPLGGKMVVTAAISIAQSMGISETLIGLTIVALGTSLPEAAAASVAAWKGKADIAIGNVVGSNIFNICWVLGISAIIRPVVPTTDLTVDLLIVIASSILLFYLVHTGPMHHRPFFFWRQHKAHLISRAEGALLLVGYVLYLVYVGMRG